jgi:hypothetical protein
MADKLITLLDMTKRAGTDQAVGLIEEVTTVAPELMQLPALASATPSPETFPTPSPLARCASASQQPRGDTSAFPPSPTPPPEPSQEATTTCNSS